MASDALLAVSARLTGCRRLLAAFWGGTELGLDGGWTEEVLFVGVGSMYVYKFWTRLVIHFCGNALGHSLAISATEFNELVIPPMQPMQSWNARSGPPKFSARHDGNGQR